MKRPARFILFLPLLVMLIVCAQPAFAAKGEIQSFTFQDMASDVLGMKEDLSPDKMPDAHFVVSIKGLGAITGVSLKAIGTDRGWDTVPGNDLWAMVVKDGQGETLTTLSGALSARPFLGYVTLDIYVADDGTAFSEKREYEITVSFVDGSTATAKTTVAARPEVLAAKPAEPQVPQVGDEISVVLYGIGDKDVVQRGETIKADGVKDAHFRIRFDAISVVEEIAIRNVDGTSSAWDTVPGNGIWAVAVFKGNEMRNKSDGSVKFAVEGDTTLDLWVADNGSIAKGGTQYEVIVKFNDGTTLRKVAVREETTGIISQEGILDAVLQAPGKGDLTSRNELLKSDGKADWKIATELSARGTIVNIVVRGDDGATEWDTIPGNGKWLVAVTDASGKVLNASNGSVSIPVSGRKILNLWVSDNGTIVEGDVAYKVIVVMNDGRILERSVTRDIESAAAPQFSDKIRAKYLGKGPKNYLPKGEISTLLASADANPDAHVKLELRGIKGTIESITIQALDGESGAWDTIPGNGTWNIVVTRTASGNILSDMDGSFRMDVIGETELHLWLADNGKFGTSPENFEILLQLADGQVLRNKIKR